MAEDKARDRRESLDSGRERNAVIRSQGPDADRMDFINGLLAAEFSHVVIAPFRFRATDRPKLTATWRLIVSIK